MRIIRPATEADYEALIAVGHEFFKFNAYRHHSKIDEPSLLRTFHQLSTDHVLLVMEVAGRLVGTAGAFIAPVYWNHYQLQGLEAFWWVDPAYRMAGAGTELRMALQRRAKEKGAEFWNMIALKESMHDEVCADYERQGMVHVETVYMKVL